jgi:hypothetical protein
MRTLLVAVISLAAVANVGFAQNTAKPGVEVVLSRENPLHLQVSLTSGAANDIKLNPFELPWGNRYSMVLVATKPNAEALELAYPIDDPRNTQITVKAGETLTGEIDLRDVIRDMKAVKKSDVLLFWAYKAPAALRLPHWVGGLVVIPQQK